MSLPVKRDNNALTRFLFLQTKGADASRTAYGYRSVNLTKMGILYIVASVCQLSWLYHVIAHWDIAMKWADVPVLGWVFVALWIGMLILSPWLCLIGIGMIRLSRNPDFVVSQTPQERRRMLMLAFVLCLSIIMDILVFVPLLGVTDKSLVIFATGLVGGRMLAVTMEGVFQYYGW